jgi:hypothetical protein
MNEQDKELSEQDKELSKKEYDAYMNNSENFIEEEDLDEPSPSQMNEELRSGGW